MFLLEKCSIFHFLSISRTYILCVAKVANGDLPWWELKGELEQVSFRQRIDFFSKRQIKQIYMSYIQFFGGKNAKIDIHSMCLTIQKSNVLYCHNWNDLLNCCFPVHACMCVPFLSPVLVQWCSAQRKCLHKGVWPLLGYATGGMC